MINDVSGFSDPAMGKVVADSGAAWVLMHMPHAVGAMQWSQQNAGWPGDVDEAVERIALELQHCIDRALAAGVARSQLAIDPGIGFGKSVAQNLALLRPQPALAKLGLPLYLGPSRKSFLKAVARPGTAEAPRDRDFATAAAVAAAVWSGAAFIRVHDVAAMRQVIDTALALGPMG
jgi:dihydropteroate synthase